MIFKIYNCDFGITLNGVNYDFDHVQGLQIEDPERTRLTRGANAGNTTGIVYRESVKEPKVWTLTVLGMTKAVHDLLKEAYKNQTRLDCYAVDRTDGSSKIAKNGVLSQPPKQLSMDDSAESMNTSLIIESFDDGEIHKA